MFIFREPCLRTRRTRALTPCEGGGGESIVLLLFIYLFGKTKIGHRAEERKMRRKRVMQSVKSIIIYSKLDKNMDF